MMLPCTNPNKIPITNINGITTYGLIPAWSNAADAVVVNATTPPTERSIPPVRITNVMPIEPSSRVALLMNRLKKDLRLGHGGIESPAAEMREYELPGVRAFSVCSISNRMLRAVCRLS
jgi:hypothetical protein